MFVLGLMLSIGALTTATPTPGTGSCKIPPRLELAEFLGDRRQETFPMGYEANYICRPGYVRLGPIKMICAEGKWLQISKGQCKKKRCGNPGDIDFGTFEIKNEDDFVFGAIVEYSCEPGYQFISKYKTIECTATGWSKAAPHCEARLCPPVVDDSVRVLSSIYDDEYTAGHVIKLECKNPRDKLTGPSQIYCTSNGTWNVDPPTCKARLCPPVVDYSVRVLSTVFDEGYMEGHVMHLECKNPNDKLTGPSQIYCRSNGTWNVDPPTCKARICPPVVDDSVRVLSSMDDEEYTAGHIIKLECKNPRDKLTGPSQIYCTSKGIWNVDPPTCKGSCRVQNNKMKPHNIQVKNYQMLHVAHSELIEFECVPGYEISDPKNLIIKCNEGMITYPTCHLRARLCPAVVDDSVRVLSTVFEEGYIEGHVMHLECKNPDYKLTGPSQIYCRSNGTWNVDPPTCKARLCPPVVDDSVRVLSTVFKEGYIEGHVMHLECKNPDNKLTGPSQIYCRSNGTWNVDPPTCKGQCIVQNEKMQLHNIQVKNCRKLRFAHNEVIKFKCVPGYKISDPKNLTIKCNEGVITYPTCLSKEKMKNKTCLPPPVIFFGESMGDKKQEYESGSIIQIKCFSYYKLKGNKTIKCQNGVWNRLPTCLAPCTLNDNYIKGNNTYMEKTEKYLVHGETVKLNCLPNFRISNPKLLTVKCMNGTLKYPNCVQTGPCVLNENTMLKNNITVKGVSKHCGSQTLPNKCNMKTYQKNETIEFTCLPGYEISDPEKLTVICHSGLIEYPKCFE